MFFTQEDYKKIQQWLTKNSVKDTEFNEANIPFNGEEIITIVQGNQNKRVFLKDLVAQVFNLGVSDFVNITDKYDAPNISLEEAIRLIPSRARKEGQVITFLDMEDHWHIYQFKGALNQWNVLDTWEDLFDWEKLIINSILPDEEDLTKSPADANGNSYLSLKDRAYNPEDFSGLGRVILRKNIVEIEDPIYCKVKKNVLYQDMINKENTIYEIRYDFDLNGAEITIPEGCVLDFKGGSLSSGTIIGNETKIIGNNNNIFKENIIIRGTWVLEIISTSLFKSLDLNTVKNMSYLSTGTHYKTVLFDKPNIICLLEEGTIFDVKSNTHVIITGTISFGEQTENVAYELFRVNSNNVIIEGGHLVGNIENRDDFPIEWGNAITIYGSENVIIRNIFIEKFQCDGIYISSSRTENSTIVVDNVDSFYNRRQAISITACNKVILKNSRFNHTGAIKRGSLGRGLDIEPNSSYYGIGEIEITNCEFIGNQNIAIGVTDAHGSKFNKISIENTVFDGLSISSFDNASIIDSKQVKRYFPYTDETTTEKFDHNHISFINCKNVLVRGVVAEQTAIGLSSNSSSNILFEDCIISCDGTNDYGIYRTFINVGSVNQDSDVKFNNCRFNLSHSTLISAYLIGFGSNQTANYNCRPEFYNCIFNLQSFVGNIYNAYLSKCVFNTNRHIIIQNSKYSIKPFIIEYTKFNITSGDVIISYNGTLDETKDIADYIWKDNLILKETDICHIPILYNTIPNNTKIILYGYDYELSSVNQSQANVIIQTEQIKNPFLQYKETHNKKAVELTSSGWYRITDGFTLGEGGTAIIMISRVYNTQDNESYIYAVTYSYSGAVKIRLLSSSYPNITDIAINKLRVTSGTTKYIDIYYNISRRNKVVIEVIGIKMSDIQKIGTTDSEAIEYGVLPEYGTSTIRQYRPLNSNQIATIYFDTDLNKSLIYNGTKFIESDGASAGVKRYGNTASRPISVDIYIGFEYFDTDLGKPIYAKALAGSPYYTVTWIDATGADV